MVLKRPLQIFNGFWGDHHHWMFFGRSDHCNQWFYDGFLILLPSLSMVSDGSGPLVKRCDGFDGSLWSRSLLPVFLSRSDLLNCRQQFHQHYTFCHDYWYTTKVTAKEVQQDERGKRKRSRKGMRIEDWQQQPTPPASSCPPNYCASLEQSTHPHPAERSSHTCDQKIQNDYSIDILIHLLLLTLHKKSHLYIFL